MNTEKFLALGLLLFSVGCSADNDRSAKKNEQRALAVVPGGSGIDGCQNIQSVCTASYPSTCYDYCADTPPDCKKVEICTMSYPPTCHEICEGPTVPPGGCDASGSAIDSDGNEYPICIVEPDPDGNVSCTKVWICQQSYPEVCKEVCQEDLGGGSSPGDPGGSEPGGSAPGAPGGSEPSPSAS